MEPERAEEKELAGRTALVTGAGRGIGRAVALELCRLGARVVLVGRNGERLAEVEQRVREYGGEARTIAADIADAGWLGGLDELGTPIDVVVHGAAAFARYAPLEEVSEEEAAEVLDVSLRAALRLTAATLPSMKERGFGRIVFLGSLAGGRGAHGQAVYAAAKAGLVGLMRSTALEGATAGVTANLLELGLIDTERVREAVDPRAVERIVARTPVGRMGSPEEVAVAVTFLVSPRAAYITGAVLPVTGGLGLGLFPEQLG